jgi:hypothetical protein
MISVVQNGPVVNATKVTGTKYVPAGKTTFIVKMINDTYAAKVFKTACFFAFFSSCHPE